MCDAQGGGGGGGGGGGLCLYFMNQKESLNMDRKTNNKKTNTQNTNDDCIPTMTVFHL